ncbi:MULTISPECIES: hypothetical protein [Calothrix]|uniref:Uncharacterized protein n=2 Tax=Calothrix TaxID=1186 RepID=A0ABR8ABV3_9CYAN|nr:MULTISPECIES: hypothetical protein [Calothrix]MBD2197244.1 hypothetical protein [Calothrix parietina FACHB-288]MBD2225923.1 hypothetical protein [Calothrix anomala FACHB-343]
MTQLNTLELAKQGDANAINTLIIEWLGLPSITAKTSLKQDCLQVMLESENIPEQNSLVPLIHHGLSDLGSQTFKKVKIFGREAGEDFPDWQQELELQPDSSASTLQADVVTESVTVVTTTKEDSQLSIKEPSFFDSLFGVVAGTADAVGSAAFHTGQAVAGAAMGIGGAIGGVACGVADGAVQTGQAVAGAAMGVGEAIGSAAIQATQVAGQALAIVGNNPPLRLAIKSLNQDWLNPFIEKIDIVKAEAAVKKLQQEHPNQKPGEIAHHLMLEKAVFAGGTGLASSLAPGQAAAMFAVDFAATAALSVELVYQIAAAYGMNLTDSERKSEAVAIFGLGIGGKTAIKAGLGLLRNLPVAGAVIGASSNAVMIYALGYAACQFYEAKQNPLTLQATLVDAQIESERYLEAAISQEKIMDQILVHIVLAGNPNKSWEEILPELQTANLSPASIDAIATNIKSPPSLDSLLKQVNSDFAVPLIAQCHRIAHLDGVITPAEAKVIETIKQKLNRN